MILPAHGPYAPGAARIALAMAVSAVAAALPEAEARAVLDEVRDLAAVRFADADGAPASDWLALLEEVVERHESAARRRT
jgi:hypothetical protein